MFTNEYYSTPKLATHDFRNQPYINARNHEHKSWSTKNTTWISLKSGRKSSILQAPSLSFSLPSPKSAAIFIIILFYILWCCVSWYDLCVYNEKIRSNKSESNKKIHSQLFRSDSGLLQLNIEYWTTFEL